MALLVVLAGAEAGGAGVAGAAGLSNKPWKTSSMMLKRLIPLSSTILAEL